MYPHTAQYCNSFYQEWRIKVLTIVDIHIYRNYDIFIFISCFIPGSHHQNSSGNSGKLHSRMPSDHFPPHADHLGLGDMPMFIMQEWIKRRM